jgi:hypothetical protein
LVQLLIAIVFSVPELEGAEECWSEKSLVQLLIANVFDGSAFNRAEECWTEKTVALIALEGEEDWSFVYFTFELHLYVGCVLTTRKMGEYEVG